MWLQHFGTSAHQHGRNRDALVLCPNDGMTAFNRDPCYLDLPGTSRNKMLNRNFSQLGLCCLGGNKDANPKAPTSLKPAALRMFPSLGGLICVLWDRLWRWSTKRLPPVKAKHDAFKMCRVTAGRRTTPIEWTPGKSCDIMRAEGRETSTRLYNSIRCTTLWKQNYVINLQAVAKLSRLHFLKLVA